MPKRSWPSTRFWMSATARNASLSCVRRSGLSFVGGDVVVRRLLGPKLAHLVLEAHVVDERERVGQRVGVGHRERSGGAGDPQALRRRSAGHPRRHRGPARERDDRDRPAPLEVQTPAVLAGVLDDEAAEKAGRRTLGEGEARQQPQQRGMVRRQRERVGDRSAGVHPPHRAAVDDHRGQHERLLLRGILQPAAGLPLPRVHRAHERRRGRVDAMLVETQPARLQAVEHPPADGRQPVTDGVVLGEEHDRRVQVGAGQRLAARLAAHRQPREIDAGAVRTRLGHAPASGG